MRPIPEVAIVIVNYNTGEYTAGCLDSIYENPPEASFEIVLVDNASTDGSADWLEANYPQVKLIRSEVNKGIAGGNNLGVRASSSRYVLLLNNDTIVLPGTIDRLVAFLKAHPEASGAGGTLLNPDQSFQSGVFKFPSLYDEFINITKLGLLLRATYPSYPPSPEAGQADWLSTAFMLFRREALEEVGLVDEEFFIYADETDLQYRLWKAGWKNYYLPEVETIHFGGKSLRPWTSRPLKYRGRLLYFIKHKNLLEVLLLRAMFSVSSLIKLTFWSLSYMIPRWNERASNELRSHYSILKLSILPFKNSSI